MPKLFFIIFALNLPLVPDEEQKWKENIRHFSLYMVLLCKNAYCAWRLHRTCYSLTISYLVRMSWIYFLDGPDWSTWNIQTPANTVLVWNVKYFRSLQKLRLVYKILRKSLSIWDISNFCGTILSLLFRIFAFESHNKQFWYRVRLCDDVCAEGIGDINL